MSFRAKILAVLITVGVSPVVMMGWLSFKASQEELLHTVGRLQNQNVMEIARYCEEFVLDRIKNLRLAVDYIPFEQLSSQELTAVLNIPYRQLPHVNIITIIDEHGNAIVPPVFDRDADPSSDPAAHVAIGEEGRDLIDLESFSRHIPLAAALEHGVAIGPPYRGRGSGSPRLAVAVQTNTTPIRILAAEFSLLAMQRRMEELAFQGDMAFLVDSAGSLIAHSDASAALSPQQVELVQTGLQQNTSIVREVRHVDDEQWFAAFASVGQLGWGVVVAQKVSVAFRAAERVRRLTALWAGLALVMTIFLGVLLARGLSRPINALSAAAKALTQGSYEHRVDIDSRDEIGQLADAFNHMASGIQRRDDEIRLWNQQLQQRVKERTAELAAAQDQILRTRRLTALGSLSAGLAHALNNPLTGIKGLISIVLKHLDDGPNSEHLRLAQTYVDRTVRIVSDFRGFADREREVSSEPFALSEAVNSALDLYSDKLEAQLIELSRDADPELPQVRGDAVQIQQVVAHLLLNAIDAMPEGGELGISICAVGDDAIRLRISDTGHGMPKDVCERVFDPFFTTKGQATQVGLGLSIAHSIVQEHHGKISVESEEGHGSIFTVILPADSRSPHLR